MFAPRRANPSASPVRCVSPHRSPEPFSPSVSSHKLTEAVRTRAREEIEEPSGARYRLAYEGQAALLVWRAGVMSTKNETDPFSVAVSCIAWLGVMWN